MNALERALGGPKGDLDVYLEARNEQEIRDDILALLATDKLTKREHFAGLAMQAVIAKNPPCGEYHLDMSECDKPAIYARAATLYADALIAELAK